MTFDSILIVGCGNMAGAMLEGWLAAGRSPERFTVVDPAPRDLPTGVRKLPDLPEGETFDVVLLGIKPQVLAAVAPQVAPLAGPATLLVSILAGVDLAVLRAYFAQAGALLRIMPNLSAALGKSPIALAADGLDASGRAAAVEWLAPLGSPEWVAEADFDLVTALAGSGPAFVYRFIDALAQAAIKLGLPEAEARRLALATVDGAAALAAVSPHAPGELARRVASPGGVTQAGLEALDAGDALADVVTRTLRAARDRSAQMAAEARGKG